MVGGLDTCFGYSTTKPANPYKRRPNPITLTRQQPNPATAALDTARKSHTHEAVQADLQRQRLAHLTENALTVAQNLRRNYFHNTDRFLADPRRRCREPGNPVVALRRVPDASWADLARGDAARAFRRI